MLPCPPVPVPVYPEITLIRCEVPIPFLRGILLRNGVGRGVNSFAGASRSNAAKEDDRGVVSVISLAISALTVRCVAKAFCSEPRTSGVRLLFEASASSCAVGS